LPKHLHLIVSFKKMKIFLFFKEKKRVLQSSFFFLLLNILRLKVKRRKHKHYQNYIHYMYNVFYYMLQINYRMAGKQIESWGSTFYIMVILKLRTRMPCLISCQNVRNWTRDHLGKSYSYWYRIFNLLTFL
jgi:hypothetical protein